MDLYMDVVPNLPEEKKKEAIALIDIITADLVGPGYEKKQKAAMKELKKLIKK